ncbi:MAG: hypothetical protein SCAL_000095 [Candidatus Syntrophoarchaeum caldarius]|uniref:Uncharacterized protein n=1 Tax=Candidatus Syntropharchaeum caldarium TaxID=1838285 RepID=A0A1F2PAI7_9EURY|nr:MAG: hypothetical protein SCAL_000095 [Candidatus Syntrophoarchaeum caldarius]
MGELCTILGTRPLEIIKMSPVIGRVRASGDIAVGME